MNMFGRCLAIISVLFVNFAASGQLVCPPNFPTESPVASYSPDDIPPTDIDMVTYTGAYAKAQANHNMSFVQITPNDQRVWFFLDGVGVPLTFYNRRVRDTESSPWRWLYSSSPSVTDSSPAAVLYSPTPRYWDSVTQTSYSFLMYQIYQPS